MKIILILVVVLVGVWLWRTGRQGSVSRDSPKTPANPSDPQEMVSCQLCALHFPRSEAVTGRLGLYCCGDHRQRAEP
jgi:uncharacterized protein